MYAYAKTLGDFTSGINEASLHSELDGGVGVPGDFLRVSTVSTVSGQDPNGDDTYTITDVYIKLTTEPDAAGKSAIDTVIAAHTG